MRSGLGTGGVDLAGEAGRLRGLKFEGEQKERGGEIDNDRAASMPVYVVCVHVFCSMYVCTCIYGSFPFTV